jgi:hypothetical protein
MPRPEPDRLPPETPSSPEIDEDEREAEVFEGLLLRPEVPATPRTITNMGRFRRRII